MPVPLARLAAALCIAAAPAQAHEFWIEAAPFAVPSGAPVAATFRIGETMRGSPLAYVPSRTARFDMVVAGETIAVPAIVGDVPAFAEAGLPDGLLTIVHETTDGVLRYDEWERWVAFTDGKDASWTQAAHRARGLPETGFAEGYRRYAKALVAVGSGAGADAARGLRAEIVAGANPYRDDLSGGLPVTVLLDGAPRPFAQVEAFARDAAGLVTVTLHRADARGRALVPVTPGRDYLLDAVALEAVEPAAPGDPVWRSLWASLTFAVPGE